MEKRQLVIFTDLDGTFLGHHDYSHAKLDPVLPVIRDLKIPLVYCSSKTRAEMEKLREETGNHHPFIVENGGAVFWPSGYFPQAEGNNEKRDGYHLLELGIPRVKLLQELNRIRTVLGAPIRSFADMTAWDLAESSGLSVEAARLAREREYDEPFEIMTQDSSIHARVAEQIARTGLNCTRGGRYWHILGNNDKGKACRFLMEMFRMLYPSMITAGFGDSANDLPMLQAVDLPILVKRGDGTYDPQIRNSLSGVILAEGVGPEGWARAVQPLLSRFGRPKL